MSKKPKQTTKDIDAPPAIGTDDQQPEVIDASVVDGSMISLHVPNLVAPQHRPHEIHVDVRLTGDQAASFVALREALRSEPHRLACNRPVHNNPDVVRWMFEQIAKAVAQ